MSKKYSEMTSQERYDRFVERGDDPHGQGRAFCHDCGFFPAYKPRVLVANRLTMEVDKYHLDLPHLCDGCAKKRGLPRYGYLIPKTEEALFVNTDHDVPVLRFEFSSDGTRLATCLSRRAAHWRPPCARR